MDQKNLLFFIVMQLLAMAGGAFFWYQVFPKKENRMELLMGIFLYMVCPFRLVSGTVTQRALCQVGFSLFLLICAALVGQKKHIYSVVPMIALAVTGFADFRLYLIMVFTVVLLALFLKKWMAALFAVATVPIAVLGNMDVVKFVLMNVNPESFCLTGIMPTGYDIDNLFRAFVLGDGKPGMGTALLVGVVILIWVLWVRKRTQDVKSPECMRAFGIAALILTIMSLIYFPLDFVQRVSPVTLRLVSYMETQALCFGVAQLCLSVLGTFAFAAFQEREDKNATFCLGCVLIILGIGESAILLGQI